MQAEVFENDDAVAGEGARRIAAACRQAVSARGRFLLAVSGGHTPWQMLRALALEDLPWQAVHLFQVDERAAPAGDPDRNWTHVLESLGGSKAPSSANLHPMPVDDANLPSACERYQSELKALAGSPPVLDLVHLGLGPDGHTASLVPGDRVLEERTAAVAPAGPYQGRPRMTLTFPVLDGARARLWLVTGSSKAAMLKRLVAGDDTIPAGRVNQAGAIVLADRAAAAELNTR